MCANALVLNFYFINIFILNFIHNFELKVHTFKVLYTVHQKEQRKPTGTKGVQKMLANLAPESISNFAQPHIEKLFFGTKVNLQLFYGVNYP